jgi:hypothetical protein
MDDGASMKNRLQVHLQTKQQTIGPYSLAWSKCVAE